MPLVRLDHDPLERPEVGVLAEEVHLADRSVQHMVHLPAGWFSRCSLVWVRGDQGAVAAVNTSCVPVSVPLAASLFLSPPGRR